MRNNKVFIVCSTKQNFWKGLAHNMEKRVVSPAFFLSHGDDGMTAPFEAVSPRTLLTANETDGSRRKVLKDAMRGCSYVYPVGKWEDDPECVRLVRRAKWTFKRIIKDTDPI